MARQVQGRESETSLFNSRRLVKDSLLLPLTLAIICGSINLCLFCYDTFDLALALPIAKARAGLGIYDRTDLLIDSGFRIPFHVYSVASFLYRLGLDVELFWYILHCIVFSVTTFCFWFLAKALSQSSYVASVSAVVLSFSRPIYGSLNWCPIPHGSLVTAAVAVPFCLIALRFVYSGKPLIGLLISSIAFNLHPYVALISIAGCLTCFLCQEHDSKGRAVGLAILAILPVLPNLIAILVDLPDNFRISDESPLSFLEQFKLYADHVYPSSHWGQGYTVFFINLLLLATFWSDMPVTSRRVTGQYLSALGFLLLVYNLNVYTFGYKALLLTFLFRVTYFIKPITFIVITSGIFATCSYAFRSGDRAKRIIGMLAAACWLFSSLRVLPPSLVEIFALLAAGFLLSLRTSAGLRRLLLVLPLLTVALFQVVAFRSNSVIDIASYSYGWLEVATLFGVLVGAVLSLVVASRQEWVTLPSYGRERLMKVSPLVVGGATAMLILFLNLSISKLGFDGEICNGSAISLSFVREKARLANCLPESREMVGWVRKNTNPDYGFIVPPDSPISLYFRVLTDRPVYVTKFDINQLAFDSRVYYEGHRRLLSIGAKIDAKNKVDCSDYNKLTEEMLLNVKQQFNAGYVLFEKPAVPTAANLRLVYEDRSFLIYSLRDSF